MNMKTLIVGVAAIAALTGVAQGKSVKIAETTPESRVGNVTKDKTRDPGLFGAHWWANRFLSRHMQIEKFKGKSVDVVLLGDSIVHFWEWKQPECWKRFTANRTALNLGYGGDRTQHVLWRIAHGELDGYEAKHVVLMIGTNNNSAKDTDPKNVASAIELIVSKIREKQPKAKIILHPIFPRGNSAQSVRHLDARARNDKTNALLKAFAERDGKVVWIDFNSKLVDETGWVPASIMADQIHPTSAGYDLWMEALAPCLAKECK
jgi:beta-glucosidase